MMHGTMSLNIYIYIIHSSLKISSQVFYILNVIISELLFFKCAQKGVCLCMFPVS